MTYCHNVTLGRRDFYRQLCLALGLPRGGHRRRRLLGLSTHVEQLAQERLLPVFLVDEAHLLHQDTLDHLHILLNYAWDTKALLSLILVGLPELDDRLRLRRNRSLYSRLHHRLCIGPLTPDDTADYVRMRVVRAGGSKDLFPSDAVALHPRSRRRTARRRSPRHPRPASGGPTKAKDRRAGSGRARPADRGRASVRRFTLTAEQLAAAPELAVLAVLEVALRTAILALVAAWPELNDLDDDPLDEPRAALELVERARDLGAAVNRYRLALATAHGRQDDLPF